MEQSNKHYEVRCLHCDVSFPVGTKRCIHCGNRIGGRSAQLTRAPRPFSQAAAGEAEPLPEGFSPTAIGDQEPSDADEETPSRSPLRIGMSVVWLLVLAIGMVTRMCAEGGG